MARYLTRYIEQEIKETLETSGVVVVAGPKFCGKTTTCQLFAKSKFVLDTKAKIDLAQSNPEGILVGASPRLIDEWQNVPDLWNAARSFVDASSDKFGLLLFTGSSTPADKNEIYHSGAGRIVTIDMRTMSLFESGESDGAVSIKDLFDNPNTKLLHIDETHSIHDTAFYICRGGWPLSITPDRNKSLRITQNYYSTLFEFENSKNKKFRNKKPEIFFMILRSYARHISTEAKRKTLMSDVNEHDDRNLDPETFDSYVEALKDLYIIKDIEAWNPNLRSRTSIITSPTRHFIDTSIAAGALHISPDDLINDPETFGLFFEDFAIKELSVYAQPSQGIIQHYRDGNGLECDAVLRLNNGKYALIEIKLGGENLVAEGSKTLLALRKKILGSNHNPPSFLMIITASGNAYTTSDGIYVVPIHMLRG